MLEQSEIPEDVMEASFECLWSFSKKKRWFSSKHERAEEIRSALHIARAILAERERCAAVAESFGAEWREDAKHWVSDGMVNVASTSLMLSDAAYKISNYIRNPKSK